MKGRYDIKALCEVNPNLEKKVIEGPKGLTIDFSDPDAVKQLNLALLKDQYQMEYWDFPEEFLCPPIPGRQNYIHSVAKILSEEDKGRLPRSNKITGLDVGTGASLIYPIIAFKEYAWQMRASEIDEAAFDSAQRIIASNKGLAEAIELRLQSNKDNFFKGGILTKEDHLDFSICNPPFFASLKEAQDANIRKNKNLKKTKQSEVQRNFGGKYHELVYQGGEKKFILNMIQQSRAYGNNVMWFSCLVSNQSLLSSINNKFASVGVFESKQEDLSIGNKRSRVVFWTFLNEKQRSTWVNLKWH